MSLFAGYYWTGCEMVLYIPDREEERVTNRTKKQPNAEFIYNYWNISQSEYEHEFIYPQDFNKYNSRNYENDGYNSWKLQDWMIKTEKINFEKMKEHEEERIKHQKLWWDTKRNGRKKEDINGSSPPFSFDETTPAIETYQQEENLYSYVAH